MVLTAQNVRGRLQELGCFSSVGIQIDTSDTGSRDYTVSFQVGPAGNSGSAGELGPVQVEELKRMTGSVNTMVGNNEGSLTTGLRLPNLLGRGERLQAAQRSTLLNVLKIH